MSMRYEEEAQAVSNILDYLLPLQIVVYPHHHADEFYVATPWFRMLLLVFLPKASTDKAQSSTVSACSPTWEQPRGYTTYSLTLLDLSWASQSKPSGIDSVREPAVLSKAT